MDLRALGTRIKAARETKNWSPKQLADCLGLEEFHINLLEQGEKPPKLETFLKEVNFYG